LKWKRSFLCLFSVFLIIYHINMLIQWNVMKHYCYVMSSWTHETLLLCHVKLNSCTIYKANSFHFLYINNMIW
jgi:hypothetical protein